jgi:hypothetical protein
MTEESSTAWAFLDGAVRIRESWREGVLALTGEVGGVSVSARCVWSGAVGGWWRGPDDAEERPHPWALRGEVAESNVDRDVLGRFVATLAGAMLGRPPRSRRHFPPEWRETLAWADRLSKQLLAPFSAAALRAARRFPRGLRAELVRLFTDDQTGRLAQLADCPGLVLLLIGLRGSPDTRERAIAERLARAVIDGRNRDDILTRTLAALLAHRASEAATGLDGALREAYRWRLGHPSELRESRWELLVRRAGATVDPQHILRPPPLAFVPTDIPAERVANALWYENMAMHDAVVNPMVAGGVEVAKAYGRLLSYVAAHESRARFARPEVLRWLQADPRRPFRRWAPDELYRRIRHPPARDRSGRRAREASEPCPGPRPGPFPPPPLPALHGADDRLEPLTTPYALEREGEAMRHCVGGYVEAVFAGRSYIYAGQVAGERVTVELVPASEGWAVRQVRGHGNAPPSPATRERLAAWCPRTGEPEGVRPWLADIECVPCWDDGPGGDFCDLEDVAGASLHWP